MQIGSMLGTGVKALAFAALNRFDTLNSLVNRMTGGSINRDTLAQKVLRDAVHMGLEMQFAKLGMGERSATLVPLAGKIVYGNNTDEIYASIKGLTHEMVLHDTNYGAGVIAGIKGVGAAGLKLGAAGVAEGVAQAVTETQFTEKLLATMLKQHSFETLAAYMDKSLAGMPFKGFAGDLVKNVLQRAVVDQPGLDQSERPVFRLLANLGNDFLRSGSYGQSLSDYFMESTQAAPHDLLEATGRGMGQALIKVAGAAADTIGVIAEGYSDTRDHLANGEYFQGAIKAVNTVTNATAVAAVGVVAGTVPVLVSTAATLTGITARAAVGAVVFAAPTVQAGATTLYQGAMTEAGRIYDTAAGPPAYRNAWDVFTKEIDQAAQSDKPPELPQPDARTSDSQWAHALIRQQTALQYGLPGTLPGLALSVDAVDQAFEQGHIDAARRDALLGLADQLSPAQLSPLGPFSATQQVAHNVVTGHLARMAAECKARIPLAGPTTQAMAQALDTSPVKPSEKAGYKMADTYAAHVGRLDLDFPDGVYSYTDASKDNLQGASNLWWGENVSLADRAELRKLYNTCGGNEAQMLEVSSYLDPAVALQALSAPVQAELDPGGQGVLQLPQPQPDGLQLKLADTTPQYRYQLRREGDNVQVTITSTWNIAQYGPDAQQWRSPRGAQASQLTSSITITVPPGGPARHSAPRLECTIRNEFQFAAHGQMELPATTA
ncbi:hypothetical protein [Comamonas antarctica]|uniref:Uncharacterized protein n=1 Tax=Comamonas antarctica TaxID=2743470 RepID=A0A6N1X034_9BURK|nr:hypothetical protein [Comamonas antarctica]QKV51436.1 hypothetical protein HUK68_00205 [Comamonas antarctica]